MENRGLRFGHLLALGGSALALLGLWLPWYTLHGALISQDVMARFGARLPTSNVIRVLAEAIARDQHVTAWRVFAGADIAIAIAAGLTILLLVAAAGTFRPSVDVATSTAAAVALWLGAAMSILIAYKFVNHPLEVNRYTSVAPGAWASLTGAVLTAVGGWAARGEPEKVLVLRPAEPA